MKKINLAFILIVSTFSSSIYGQVFQPQTKAELQTAVNLWVDDNPTALENYGEINTWDVSQIVDMSGLFRNKTLFNSDISGWDVSSVTSMGAMFENASSFDGDISEWDVSNVTDMFGMFVNAASFSSDLSTWDVSNVTNMQGLFACYGCNSTFNSDLSSWDVSNVVNMRGMFSWITYNQDLSSWDVSNVGNMSEMFWGNNAFNQDLSSWDVSNVSNMSHMFQGSSSFDQNISEWNVSTVSNMKQMFQGSNAFNQDLSSWDVSNVSDMSNIFDGANSLTDENKCSIESTWSLNENWPYDWSAVCNEIVFQPQTKEELQTAVNLWVDDNTTALETYGEINTWDVSLITDMSELFKDKTTFNDDIGEWNLSNVTKINYMFWNAVAFDRDISSWNVSSVAEMGHVFRNATNFNQDISSWNVSNVYDLGGMFWDAIAFNQDVSSWDISSVINTTVMFRNATTFNQDISGWDVSNIVNMSQMFRDAIAFNQNISSWDVSNVNLIDDIFLNTNALSDENKCSIESTWSSNENWPYDWSELCPLSIQDNYSLIFDGDADYVETGVVGGNIRDGFSAEVSFKTSDINAKFLGKYGNVCGLGYAQVYFGLMEGIPVLLLRSNNGASSTAVKLSENVLSNNEWHDIQVVYDGSEEVAIVHATIDGVQSQITQDYWGNEPILSLTSDLSQLPYFIGATDICHPAQVYYDGKLSKVKIYDQAVVDFSQEGALFDFSFSDGSGATLFDLSGNENHGTIVGASWDDDVPSTYIEGYVYVPDNNFEQALIDLGYDDILDDYVLEENVNQVTEIYLSNLSIESLQGIEGFVSLQSLNAYNNDLNSVNLSANLNLSQVNLHNNHLSSIDVSTNTNLEFLNLEGNYFTSLDVSNNVNLITLNVNGIHDYSGTSLSELDLSNNVNLQNLSCSWTQLGALDLSNQPNLSSLYAHGNGLSEINLISNPLIGNLNLGSNELTQIDLSNLENLYHLTIAGNNLSQLDLSTNLLLRDLNCAGNQLTDLNVEANTELQWIQCSRNSIESLNVSSNINLRSLEINNLLISEVDLTNNVNLEGLWVHDNSLSSLDLSNNGLINRLYAQNCQLPELNISNLDSLEYLVAHDNQLTEVNLNNNLKINGIDLSNNSLQYLDLMNNNKLRDARLGNNVLRSVSFNNMEDLRVVDVANNSLRSLGLKHSSAVFEELYATNNPELVCIEVLDERYHTDRFSFENNNIDEGVTFSTICNATAYQPQLKEELIEAVHAWTMGDFLTYGNISDWDVSLITDMSHLFEANNGFNGDLSSWDVSSVTNMNHMFKNASSFNQNIGGWDVSNVIDMGAMFLGTANFNQDIGNWNVANVTSMSHMFVNASNFNQNIGSWDVSNVSTMQAMFKSANSFSQDLNTWDVSNVIHMNYMFEANNTFNGNIAAWNTSSVIGMHKMFLNANSFDKDISNWNVSNVTDMGYMFLGAAVFNQDLSGWAVSNVTNMSSIFDNTNLSLLNQCLIHNSWLPNPNWTYGWSSACSPVIVEIGDINMDEDSELKIPLIASDPLNRSLSFESSILYPGEEFFQAIVLHDTDRDTDTLHLISTNNYFGQAQVELIVRNDNEDMDVTGFMVEILPVDDLPIVGGVIQDIFVEEDFNYNQDPNWNIHLNDVFFDIDGDLEYEVSFSDPAVVNANIENEHLTLSSIENAFGQTEMIITASNPMRASVSDTVLVTVFPVNDAPVLLEENTTLVTACHPYHIENGYGGNFFGVSPELQNHIASQDILQITQGELTHAFTVEYTTLVNNEFCVDEEGNFLTLYVYIEGELSDAFGENLMVGSLVNLPTIPTEFDEDNIYTMMSFEEMYNNGSLVDVDNDLGELSFDIFTHNDSIYLEWDGSSSSHPMIIPENNYYGPASLTICVFDSEYDSCIEKNFNISPINDAPEFHSSMDEVVGVNLEFHIDVHVDDVDSENVTLSLGENAPDWVNLSDNILQGEPADLGEFSIQLIATDGQLTTESILHLHVENFNPEIISITDVPDDQGGRVYLQFNASYFDHHDHSGQSYNIYRHDDDLSEWVVLSSVAAVGDGVYIYEATTLMDSTSENNGLTDFWVKASMHEGTFESEIVSGYSADNILPGVPEGVLASLVDNTVELTWNESIDEDFQYFIIEKIVNEVEELIETSDAFFLDENYVSNAVHSYRIASVDHAGNQSDYSNFVEVAVLGVDGEIIPAVFALYQNYPNPFNPTTQIKYDLPESANVTINIYDVLGRNISTLVNGLQNAGYHSLRWDAKNNIGEAVSAGMYIYTIQAGDYRATKKMVLLK